MQNLVILMETHDEAKKDRLFGRIDTKAGNMCLNRFSIEEDVAFDISGVYYLKNSYFDIIHRETTSMKSKRKSKGKGY